MNRFFIIIILGLILSGCSTNWYIGKAKKKCPDCFNLDTTINEIVFKLDTTIKLDTFIWIKLPADTIKIDSIIFRDIKPSFPKIIKKNGIITTEISMLKGELKVKSYLEDSLYYHLKDSIRIKDALIYKLKTINIKQNITIKEQKNKYDNTIKWLKLIGILIIIMFLTGLLIKWSKWTK